MKIVYINPNSTISMTDKIVASARAALPDVEIFGMTNHDGPAAIQGAADGNAAVPGMLSLLPAARSQGADAIVIACFDDTGMAKAQEVAGCPVLGIGHSSYVMAQLLGLRFTVVTSLAVSIPVIEENIQNHGFSGQCASVRASGLPVLTIDESAPETIDRIVQEIQAGQSQDNAACAILGCAGMAPMKDTLSARTGIRVVDGVAASAHLAKAVVMATLPVNQDAVAQNPNR